MASKQTMTRLHTSGERECPGDEWVSQIEMPAEEMSVGEEEVLFQIVQIPGIQHAYTPLSLLLNHLRRAPSHLCLLACDPSVPIARVRLPQGVERIWTRAGSCHVFLPDRILHRVVKRRCRGRKRLRGKDVERQEPRGAEHGFRGDCAAAGFEDALADGGGADNVLGAGGVAADKVRDGVEPFGFPGQDPGPHFEALVGPDLPFEGTPDGAEFDGEAGRLGAEEWVSVLVSSAVYADGEECA